MRVYDDIDLANFEFWAGARENVKYLTAEELEQIQFVMEDIYSDGIEVVQLNDIFWFDFEFIAELLDTNVDALMERNSK